MFPAKRSFIARAGIGKAEDVGHGIVRHGAGIQASRLHKGKGVAALALHVGEVFFVDAQLDSAVADIVLLSDEDLFCLAGIVQ